MPIHVYKIIIASYNIEIYLSAVILQFDPFNCNISTDDAILAREYLTCAYNQRGHQ